jgi:uncharacterized protein YbjT (DUF2867 family)
MDRRAIVAGATGLIGRELVRLLLDDPRYVRVTILVRRPIEIRHPKLETRIIDYAALDRIDPDMNGADVFCTLGTTIKKAGTRKAFREVDYGYPLALGRMAKEGGAAQFLIVTSMGASASSRIFYSRVKGEVEEALSRLELPALHIFRPSLLLGKREEFRFGERVASLLLPPLGPLLGKYRPIHARTVAHAMRQAAGLGVTGTRIYESDEIARLGGRAGRASI